MRSSLHDAVRSGLRVAKRGSRPVTGGADGVPVDAAVEQEAESVVVEGADPRPRRA